MRYRDVSSTFTGMLADVGLAESALEPWLAWKVFKTFARTPLEDVVDDAQVQYGVYEDEDGVKRAHLYLVREFSDPTAEGSEPLGLLGCDLAFAAEVLTTGQLVEFWTQDAGAFAEFVDQVESAEGFQALMSARPIETSVFLEEA
jgi:hypothetical protein